MRLLSLLTGLGGLFTVVVAAPTSVSPNVVTAFNGATDTATTITTLAQPKFGKVRICNGRRGKGTCVDLEPQEDCMPLQKPVRFNVQSLVQPKGLLCAYTTDKDCIKVAFGVNSIESKQAPDVSPKWSRLLTGVRCRPSPGTSSSIAELADASVADDTLLQVRTEVVPPETEVDVTSDASAELGKVRICNGRRGQGQCVDVNARMQCVQLPAPIRFNVQSLVQSQGNLCSYSQGKSCDSSAFTVDPSKGTVSPDVDLKWSPVITGVLCIPGPGTAQNEAVTADTKSITTSSSIGPGKVRICNGRAGKGHCVEVNTNFKCVQLSKPIRFNVQSLVQSKGNFCSYSQGKNCDNSAFVIDSSRSEQATDVTKWSRVITGVQCISGRSTALTNDLAASTIEETSPQIRDEAARRFRVRFYNEVNFKGDCLDISVEQPCFPLPDKWKHNIKSFTLSPNVMCRFYQRRSCSNKDLLIGFHSLHAPYDWLFNIPEKEQGGMTLVSCRHQDHGTAAIEPNMISYNRTEDIVTPPLAKRDDQTTATLQLRAPEFHARLYTDRDAKGNCIDFSVQQPCFPLPDKLRRNIKSLTISPNVVCEFYKGNRCKDRLFAYTSVFAPSDWTANLPDKWLGSMTLVSCRDYDWETAASLKDAISYSPFNETSPPHLEARSATAPLTGDALFCSGPLPQGPCFKTLANGQCTDLPPPVDRNVREIHQKHGSVCEYFSSDNCEGKLGSSESRNGDILVPVPAQIVRKLASVKCRRVALAMGVGEVGEQEKVEVEFMVDERGEEE